MRLVLVALAFIVFYLSVAKAAVVWDGGGVVQTYNNGLRFGNLSNLDCAASGVCSFNRSVETNDYLIIPEVTTPTPIASKGQLYTKTDDKIYFQDGSGVEHEITGNTGTAADDVSARANLGLDSSVASNELTISLKQKNGSSDPTGGQTVDIAFRNSTLTNGGYVTRSVSTALSLIVDSGATLGTESGSDHLIYVYAIDNAGTVELAVSLSYFNAEGNLFDTTILSASSDSKDVLYSEVARSNVPLRYLGYVQSNQATAGTWVTLPSREYVGASPIPNIAFIEDRKTAGTAGGTFTSGADRTRDLNTLDGDSSFVSLSSNQFTLDGNKKYLIEWSAPAYNSVNRNVSWLYDITAGATIKQGQTTALSTNAYGFSEGWAIVEIFADTTYEIRHRCQTTRATVGFGEEINAIFSVPYELYTTVKVSVIR